MPGRVAQSITRLIQEPEVPESIPGPATYFLLPLIQGGQLLVTGESMCMKLRRSKPAVRLTDRPNMTIAVYHGRITTTQHHKNIDMAGALNYAGDAYYSRAPDHRSWLYF